MLVSDLEYDLPPDLIATAPATPRDSARLMVIDRAGDTIEHRTVADLPEYLQRGDLMVFNESKVLPAWFQGTRRATGGRVTGLYLPHESAIDRGHDTDPRTWRVLLESRGKLTVDEYLDLDSNASLELIESLGRGEWLARCHADVDDIALLERIGSPPLPPYIRKARKALGIDEITDDDVDRYNTVYAAAPGSVAAPTAGLHFTDALFDRLDQQGVQRAFVTLHVGLGTFAPIRAGRVEDHDIHRESIHIPPATLAALREARQRKARIIPIGTTTVRALESLPSEWQTMPPEQGFTANTDLYITPGEGDQPGFDFRFTDALLTNFHLPRSTLLALVAALPEVGIDRLKTWYRAAVEHRYRFYSYGDAMFLR